jgi:outer membrane protein TolC
MKFRTLLAALPLLASSLWAVAPAVNGLILPEKIYPQLDVILKRAVQQSPQMISRTLEIEIAENNRIQARAGILPTAGLSFSYYEASEERADLTGGRINVGKMAYNFNVTQPLYYWGERRNNARIGEIQHQIAQGNYRDGYRSLAQEIRNQYLQLIVRKISLARSRLSNRYTQEGLKLAEDRYAKKVMSEAEIFPVRLNAERSQIELERNTYEFEAAKASFGRLTGGQPISDSAIPDEIAVIDHQSGASDQYLAGFLAQKDPPNNVAASMRRQLEIENLNYLNQKTRLLPKFNFVVAMTQDETSYTLNVGQKYRVNDIYAGVSMNWNIFDGFAAGAGTRSALARRQQVENEYKGLTDRLAREAQAQAKSLDFSARGMSLTDRILVAAAGSFQVRKAEFARGVVSENDVTQANLAYFEALINADNARIDYLLRTGEFLGTIAEDPVVANLPAKL